MKAFTSIEQSKKLAEILPLETADMHLMNSSIKGEMYVDEFKPILVPYLRAKDSLDAYSKIVNNMIAWEIIPCWSLVALLDVLPIIGEDKDTANPFIAKTPDGEYYVVYATLYKEIDVSGIHSNPVDACVEMILILNKQKIL